MMKGWAASELEPVFARARELCRQLDDPPEVFPVRWALTLFHAIRGDLRVYRERADELMVQAEASGEPAYRMAAHHLVGVSLEFLGDSVLGFVIADMLFRQFPQHNEGQKSKLKASIVSAASLARLGERLNLGDYLILGRGEEKTGGRRKLALIADCFEALIAAVREQLAPVFGSRPIGVTLQIDEGHEVFDAKHSNLHPLFGPPV